MKLIQEIEEDPQTLVLRRPQGSGAILFYTGVTGLLAAGVFAFIDPFFGKLFALLSAALLPLGYLLARKQTSLVIDRDQDSVKTARNRWRPDDIVAVALTPYLRVPAHIDDPAMLTDRMGTHLWRAWLVSSSDPSARRALRRDLQAIGDDPDHHNPLSLTKHLDAMGAEVVMQTSDARTTGAAALRTALRLGVDLYDFGPSEDAPRTLSAASLADDAPLSELLGTSMRQTPS